MHTQEAINARILALFGRWRAELETRHPHLFSRAFSNIFCPGVTAEWSRSPMRVLLVGEEATWESRTRYPDYTDNELQKCQQWIVRDLEKQLNGDEERHPSPFWRRIHALHEAFPQAAFCWSNIDCINADTRRALRETDRKDLHDCEIQLVREMVDIIHPTHILFCGWHNTSLQHEFPELCERVYPRKIGDAHFMKTNGYILKTDYQGISAVFTYHPSGAAANSNAYIARLIETLR